MTASGVCTPDYDRAVPSDREDWWETAGEWHYRPHGFTVGTVAAVDRGRRYVGRAGGRLAAVTDDLARCQDYVERRWRTR